MRRTKNLGLPIYDNPSVDLFKISDFNDTHEKIDKQYEEIQEHIKHEIGSVDLSGYATKSFVEEEIRQIELKEGPRGPKGEKGDTGATPNISIGTVTTLQAGQQATVTKRGTIENPIFDFGIPKGKDGVGGTGTNSDSLNIFTGKTATFFGDSLTEINSHYTKGYHSWVKDMLGLASYQNFGVSGYKLSDIYNKINSTISTGDIIFVFGGVNDQTFHVPLGQFGDTGTSTTYGSMNSICSLLREKYPTKLVIFITPHYQTKYPHNSGITSFEVSKAIKEVCYKYAYPVFDMFQICELYPQNSVNKSIFFTDGTHFNDKGHELVGKNLSKFILNNFGYIYEGSTPTPTPSVYGEIVLSKTSTTITEGGTDTFTVKLDKAPTNNQVVTLSKNNSDVTLNPSSLTFTSSNYSTPQTVTITVAEDDTDYSSETCVITCTSPNVSSKILTINVTDNDISPDEPDEPQEPGNETNEFIGKTFTVTGSKFAYYHLTALIATDSDCAKGKTVLTTLKGSNVSNMTTSSGTGGTLFLDNSGEVNNTSYVADCSGTVTFTQNIYDDKLEVTIPSRTINKEVTSTYLKVPIIISGSLPYSFTIDELKIAVNGNEKKILKLGGFFKEETCTLT